MKFLLLIKGSKRFIHSKKREPCYSINGIQYLHVMTIILSTKQQSKFSNLITAVTSFTFSRDSGVMENSTGLASSFLDGVCRQYNIKNGKRYPNSRILVTLKQNLVLYAKDYNIWVQIPPLLP